MSVLFLHIPKTAGQSVHQFLIDRFGHTSVCPARDNTQFMSFDLEELRKFDVYSGHVDWNFFDDIANVKFTFTILRDPMDRILSYYFYLREQAKLFEKRDELNDKPGLKAALYNSPHNFFISSNNDIRSFLDQSFDNFYTYYFAGRQYSGRDQVKKITGAGNILRNYDSVISLAESNVCRSLDGLYWITNWRSELSSDLNRLNLGICRGSQEYEYRVNKGNTDATCRLELLKDLGADDAVVNRLNEMCELDYSLLERLNLSNSSSIPSRKCISEPQEWAAQV